MSNRITAEQAKALLTLLDYTPVNALHQQLETEVTTEFADDTVRALIKVRAQLKTIAAGWIVRPASL